MDEQQPAATSIEARYRVLVSSRMGEQGIDYVARAAEIPDCQVVGATRAEAIAALEQEIAARLHNMREEGLELPSPVELESFDGQLSCKVSPELHRELAFAARSANLPLEALLVEILATATGTAVRGPRRDGSARREREQGGRRRRGSMDDKRYHGIMENRASFIEYVRQLERDGSSTGGNRGGSGRGRR